MSGPRSRRSLAPCGFAACGDTASTRTVSGSPAPTFVVTCTRFAGTPSLTSLFFTAAARVCASFSVLGLRTSIKMSRFSLSTFAAIDFSFSSPSFTGLRGAGAAGAS
jgi:hypothetical protein